jgi:hypothetical protein
MATTRFNNVILAAARRLQDGRSSAGSDGVRYTSALMAEYANRALREIGRGLWERYGEKVAEAAPELVKESGALTLSAAGVVALPADVLAVLEVAEADYGLTLFRVPQSRILSVKAGKDGAIVPSVTRPVWWIEGTDLHVLPVTYQETVVVRYVMEHTDIAVLTTAAGNGNFNTAQGTYTAATRVLAATMNANFVAGDVNKRVMFRSATVVYEGRIESRTGNGTVVLVGDGLPAGDVAAVIDVMVSDVSPEVTDIKLGAYLDGEVVERMVAMGLKDARGEG